MSNYLSRYGIAFSMKDFFMATQQDFLSKILNLLFPVFPDSFLAC